MTVLEARYMERMPNLLNELVREVSKLREEVKALNEKLDKSDTNED